MRGCSYNRQFFTHHRILADSLALAANVECQGHAAAAVKYWNSKRDYILANLAVDQAIALLTNFVKQRTEP